MPLVIKARKRNDPVLRSPTAKLNKFEQEIFDIYSKALSSIPQDLDNEKVMRTIRQAIESRSPNAGAVAFQWGDFVSSLDGTVPKLAQQLAAAANISAAALPKNIRFESSFTAQDPRAIAWAQQRAGARILGITQETQKAVAETIARSLRTQINREEVINNITQIVGLDSRQARALGNFYEKNLLKLLEQGETYEKAVKIVTKLGKEYRERLLVQRATRIARTETVAAANAGRMLSWVEADALGLLPAGSEKRWKTATDERTCPICAPMHNVTIDWEGVFSTGDTMPPNHPNCRCTAVIVPAEPTFQKTVEKRYYRFADGEKTWRNYNYKWRKIANEMKERIGKCQRCGSKSDLTVDHKKRLKDGGAKYDKKNLRVLCRSCNGKLARLGTKLRKSDNSWLLAKHAPGKHNQQNHAGGSSGSYEASASALASFQNGSWDKDDVKLEYIKKVTVAYDNKYSAQNEENENSEFQVDDYVTSGYFDVNNVARGKQLSDTSTENKIRILDRTIEQSPDAFGDKTLYRVTSDRLLTDLKPGDTFVDKGFLSTTRKNVVLNRSARAQLGNLSPTDDTVTVIIPSPKGTGKGLAVDLLLKSRGKSGRDEFWGKEKEVLLPRETPLLFLGISTTTDTEGKPVAVFQRMDK